MATKPEKPINPVAPDGMEVLFFYKCPYCAKHVPIASPTEPRMLTCDGCRKGFPIIPVDEHGIHYIRIMLAGGRAAGDPDFL